MILLSNDEMAYGLLKLLKPKEIFEGCLMSKQTKKSFPYQTNFSAKYVLELVHGDICSPFTPPTPVGNKYLFLLVDDCSCFIWVYML